MTKEELIDEYMEKRGIENNPDSQYIREELLKFTEAIGLTDFADVKSNFCTCEKPDINYMFSTAYCKICGKPMKSQDVKSESIL